MKTSWPPDWKDEKQYPAPEDLPLRLWAWEFLRRNPEYQKDIDSLPKGFFKSQREHFLKWKGISDAELNKFIFKSKRDVLLDTFGEFYNSESYDKQYHDVYVSSEYRNILDKFGIDSLDHYTNSFPLVFFFSEFVISPMVLSLDELFPYPIEDEETIKALEDMFVHKKSPTMSFTNRKTLNITIDLTKPLKYQFQYFQIQAMHFQEHIDEWEKTKKIKLCERIVKDKLPVFLRVLDGRTAKVKFKDIAEELIPKQKSYKINYPARTMDNDHRAALRIRDGGYYSIAAMD